MDSVQELETIEVLDIWNEEFGGIDIDWTGFVAFLADKDDGDANNNWKELPEKENFRKEIVDEEIAEKENDKKENVEKEKTLKAKRGRPRLKPLKPEVLSLRRDVSNLEPLAPIVIFPGVVLAA
jgi:hypothetical protein